MRLINIYSFFFSFLFCVSSCVSRKNAKGDNWTYNELGIGYIIKSEGEGTYPKKGQKIRIHYKGSFVSGEEFDNSYKRNQPFEFTLGDGYVIKGWEEGIKLFKEGGKGLLKIPAELAYGEEGSGNIPPHSTLIYEVEILDIE